MNTGSIDDGHLDTVRGLDSSITVTVCTGPMSPRSNTGWYPFYGRLDPHIAGVQCCYRSAPSAL